MQLDPGVVIDRYEIAESLGAGGFAHAYRATDLESGAVVTLKTPDPHLLADPGVFQRFEREVWATTTLDHPNLDHLDELDPDAFDLSPEPPMKSFGAASNVRPTLDADRRARGGGCERDRRPGRDRLHGRSLAVGHNSSSDGHRASAEPTRSATITATMRAHRSTC